jgi:hypothetical protein
VPKRIACFKSRYICNIKLFVHFFFYFFVSRRLAEITFFILRVRIILLMFLKTLKIELRCVELINFMELFYFGVVFALVNSLTTRAQYSVVQFKRKLGKTCKIIYFLLFMYLLLSSTPIVFIICTVIIKMFFFLLLNNRINRVHYPRPIE